MGGTTGARAGIITPPWHTRRALARWSIAAAAVIILWQYFILAASVTSINTSYGPWEVFVLVLQAESRDVWPGVYGLNRGLLGGQYLQIGAVLALGMWGLGLLAWRTTSGRVLWLALAFQLPYALMPGSLLASPFWLPWTLYFGTWTSITLSINGGAGYVYKDAGALAGPALWTWLVIALLISSLLERRASRSICEHCGYSLAGLPGPICPECGTDQQKLTPDRSVL